MQSLCLISLLFPPSPWLCILQEEPAVWTVTADADQASHAGCLFYFFSAPFRRPWLTIPTKQLSDPNLGLRLRKERRYVNMSLA